MQSNKSITAILIGSIILLIVLILSIIIIHFKTPTKEEPKSLYTDKAVNVMKELSVFNEINNRDYSKTVEIMLETENYQNKYLESYYQIDYQDISDFPSLVNKFLTKNYNSTEINYIFTNYLNNLDILLNMNYVDILKFKDISNFDINKINRYIDYSNKNTYTTEEVVTYVNIGLDLEGYSTYQSYTEEEANNLYVIVNKYHKLPDDYEPSDLVSLKYNVNYKLRKEAAEAFENLTNAALKENVVFYPFSPYRSFETQKGLYNNYKNRDGEEVADTYSARPGFSEHQTGLAVDVRSSNLTDNLTEEHYEWMLNNSYKYGFIVRYPKGKQFITQYIEEPWHIRYLGVDLATKVHASGLTYDEYYDLYIEKH